jgi:WD40 repeat protein/tRNA A-37 threonylcarbamoyl transferase component Bud32
MAIGLEAGPGQTPGSVKFDSFGDYELLEEIARGGMGVVYKARQKSLNRLVAVKRILFGPKHSEDFIKRFRIEASSAAALQHPNIVAIHEVGVHDGEHFLVMDYVDGPTLAELAKDQPLSAERAARYLKTVADAIHYAHEKGILHRDLKPSNVLIDSNDQPRVTDFGLAKRLGTDSQPPTDLTQLTLSGHMLGSPSYMPPEQAIGARGKMSRRSDIYSMGAMLYHLLTGRPPFGGGSMADTLYQVQYQEPVSPRLLNPAVSHDLETICLKCLEKEPARRYQTAQELADELGRFLSDEPIHARPVSRPERTWRWCRRHPQVAGLAAGIALLLFVVALGTPVALIRINREWRRAELNAGREAEERRRAERFLNRLEVQKAEELFGVDDASGGLAYLARVLRDNPSHQAAAERMLAALTQRGFTLPCLPSLPHKRGVTIARFSPDGRLLVTAAIDGSVQLWDALGGAPIRPMRYASGMVNDMQFSPNGSWVVIASSNKTAIVFDVHTGEQAIGPLSHNDIVHAASFSHSGELILTTSHDGSAKVWEAKTGRLSTTMQHDGCILHGCFSPDGQRVATASLDNTARVWLAGTGQPEGAPLRHEGTVRWVEFSPDGRRVLTASDDKTARVWDAARGTIVLPPLKHSGQVLYAEFSPDGGRIVTTSSDTKAWIWDARDGHPVTEPLKHAAPIRRARFSPDGERLITASADKTGRVWDAHLGQPLSELLPHEGAVVSAEFSPDGLRAVTASDDGTVRIWEIPRASVPVPAWLPALAEAVAGQRLNERHVMEPVPSGGLEQIRKEVLWHDITNRYVAWASWFFKDSTQRSLSPYCDVTLAEHVQRLIETNTMATLEEAVRLAPSNALALTRLAAALLNGPRDSTRLNRADVSSLRALDLSPNDEPEVWRVRIQVWDRTGRPEGSVEALERALTRAPEDPWLWYGRARLLEGEERLPEAVDAYKRAVDASNAANANSNFVNRALFRRSRLLEKLDRLSESRTDYLRAMKLPTRDGKASDSLIDLSLYYNARLDHPRNPQARHDHFGQMTTGVQRLAEVDFDVRGVVQLSSKHLIGYYPPKVEGIRISRPAKRLHFLHATKWNDPAGTHVATFVIHYASGPPRSVPIVCGRDVCNWWSVTPVPTHATVAWTGTNATATANRHTLRLFKMTWENPEPDREIRALDFRSEGKESAPFLIAITAE